MHDNKVNELHQDNFLNILKSFIWWYFKFGFLKLEFILKVCHLIQWLCLASSREVSPTHRAKKSAFVYWETNNDFKSKPYVVGGAIYFSNAWHRRVQYNFCVGFFISCTMLCNQRKILQCFVVRHSDSLVWRDARWSHVEIYHFHVNLFVRVRCKVK